MYFGPEPPELAWFKFWFVFKTMIKFRFHCAIYNSQVMILSLDMEFVFIYGHQGAMGSFTVAIRTLRITEPKNKNVRTILFHPSQKCIPLLIRTQTATGDDFKLSHSQKAFLRESAHIWKLGRKTPKTSKIWKNFFFIIWITEFYI